MAHKKLTAPPADDFSPPAVLSKELHHEWREVISDLKAIGTVTRTDIIMLTEAFGNLANSRTLKARFNQAAEDMDADPLTLSRFQSASASADGQFIKYVDRIRKMIAGRPKPEKDDDWLARTTA